MELRVRGLRNKIMPKNESHYFHLGDLGVPAQIIQDLLDYISITTTDQYVTTTKEAAMRILSTFGLYSELREEKEEKSD